MKNRSNKAQNLLEYSLIIGIVTVALLSMHTYFKRGIQSVVRVVADDYGTQGEVVGETELAIKSRFYAQDNLIEATSNSSQTQTTQNSGDGEIRATTSGSNLITGSATWIGGDYRDRIVD